uniref:Receptor-like serine/threonine-protein kinase n=1 Tax=Opuntia streptacantha TaxID=393608 RepID=A0A7C9B0U3_OPUST
MEATAIEFIRIHTLSFLFLSLLLHLLSFSSFAAEIPLGSALSSSNPDQTWSSPTNNFNLRFLAINSSAFSLAIAFASGGSIPIWTAGTVVGGGASFRLLPSGDLRLLSITGAVIWSSGTANRGVSHATLDDSGNFILKNGSVSIWSSFDHPTDTIVPSLNFSAGMILTSGLYSFSLMKTGNLTLRWNNSVVYYSSGLNSSVNANLSNPYLSLQSTGVLNLYDPKLSKPVIIAYSGDYGDSGNIFRFLKLDGDGNLRIYSSSVGSNTVTARWAAVSDQCLVFGYCGNMGICRYNDSSPICGCPSQNFELIDPGDSRKGCKLKKDLNDCPQSQAMLQLDHTLFLTHPPETNSELFFEGISACNGNCLSGPCLAFTSLGDGSGQCYQTSRSDFISGYHSAALPSTSFVKVCKPVLPNPPSSSEEMRKDDKLEGWIIILAMLGTLLGLILVEGSLWWCCCRKSPDFRGLSGQYALLEYASGAPVQFSYKQLNQATSGFKEKLGEGGFGAVYKGVLANRTFAAVKQLEGIEQGEKQFRMEVATISSTHHLNLVRLIGFCSEGRHRLLVYEYMKNGSLDSFLFANEKTETGKLLSWEQRFNIALGTARGITYLHEECRDCIVHCDIKPENILLDDNYNAKVSDFGLAKLTSQKDRRDRSLASVRGTRGYLAPEWIANLPITSKSDVYSYGMVLLETVSGRRNFEVSGETNRKKFSSWAYEEFDKGNIRSILDSRLGDYKVDMDQVIRAIQVSFWCIQEQPSQRPTMGKVVQMLEGILEIENPPAPKTAPQVGRGSFDTIVFSTSGASSSGPATCSSISFQTSRYLSSGLRGNEETPTLSLA